jgi:hypothetical protein
MNRIAYVAAVALVLSAAQGFAGERNANVTNDCGGSTENQCDDILASKDAHAPVHFRYCENRQEDGAAY